MSWTAADLSARPASRSRAIRKKAGSTSEPIGPWCMTRNPWGSSCRRRESMDACTWRNISSKENLARSFLCVGQDPLLLLAAGNPIELGYSEYDYCGGIRGRPFDFVEGEVTGLPFPAHAESPSKVFFIRATSKPMDRSANGSAITAREWKTRRCCASSASIIVTIRSYASRDRAARRLIIRCPKA